MRVQFHRSEMTAAETSAMRTKSVAVTPRSWSVADGSGRAILGHGHAIDETVDNTQRQGKGHDGSRRHFQVGSDEQARRPKMWPPKFRRRPARKSF